MLVAWKEPDQTPQAKRGLVPHSASLFVEKASKLPSVSATQATITLCLVAPSRSEGLGPPDTAHLEGDRTCPGASPGDGRTSCSRSSARGQVPCAKWLQLAGAHGSSHPAAWPRALSCPHPCQPARACPWPSCPCGGRTTGAGTAPPPAAGRLSWRGAGCPCTRFWVQVLPARPQDRVGACPPVAGV